MIDSVQEHSFTVRVYDPTHLSVPLSAVQEFCSFSVVCYFQINNNTKCEEEKNTFHHNISPLMLSHGILHVLLHNRCFSYLSFSLLLSDWKIPYTTSIWDTDNAVVLIYGDTRYRATDYWPPPMRSVAYCSVTPWIRRHSDERPWRNPFWVYVGGIEPS